MRKQPAGRSEAARTAKCREREERHGCPSVLASPHICERSSDKGHGRGPGDAGDEAEHEDEGDRVGEGLREEAEEEDNG